MTSPKHISVYIQRNPKDVYAFAAEPLNLPKWASGLSGATITKSGDSWLCESPMGKVSVKFAPRNEFGVLDHDVTLPTGDVVHNPLRVLKNGAGSEVVFTLFRQPTMTDDAFAKDAAHVLKDLQTLKRLLEA